MADILLKIGSILLLLGGLIFVHELGHFLVAKALRVKVLRFSIGFGPKLAGLRRGETEYRLAVLPLGGYVKMAGEDPTQEIAPEDRGRTFFEQPPWKRLAIALAGPAMNLVFPFFIYVALGLAQNGQPVPGPVVGTVAPGSPAAEAGLRAGDRIVAVQPPGQPSRPVRYFSDLREMVSPHPGEPIHFQVERGGAALGLTIVPASEDDSNPVERRTRGVIGVTPAWPSALVTPAPGAAGPIEPLDLVTAVDGHPVRHAGELQAALGRAGCAAVPMVVRRGGAEVRLDAVPTCRDGRPALLLADPTVAAVVAEVEPGSPAEAAGLRRGDVITGFDGRPVRSYRDLSLPRDAAVGRTVALALADGRSLQVTLHAEPYRDEVTGDRRQRPSLGFQLDRREGIPLRSLLAEELPLRRGLGEVAGAASEQLWEVTRLTVLGIGRIVTGELSLRSVGGPIMLFGIASDAVEAGLGTFLFQMALISINLGLMNLLPIPVLDGGHIVTALLEGITRRRISMRAREIANVVGLLLLFTLMIVAFGNDLMRLRG